MDRMELKKRWLMGNIHPELFYLPWGHKNKKHIIKIVSAWIDVSNLNYTHDGTTIYEAYYYNDNKELAQSANDVIEAKVTSKALGIKIYDDNQYIGGFTVVRVGGYYPSISLKPNNHKYTTAILCTDDDDVQGGSGCSSQTIVNAYTRLSELPSSIKNIFIQNGLSNPKPYISVGGHGLVASIPTHYTDLENEFIQYHCSAYYSNSVANLIPPRIENIGTPHFSIRAGCVRNKTMIWDLVNVRDRLTNNWINGDVKRQSTYKKTLYNTAYISKSLLPIFNSDINTINISIEPNENGYFYISGEGNHLYFVDGLTSEKLIEYGEKITDTENYVVITGIDDEKELPKKDGD